MGLEAMLPREIPEHMMMNLEKTSLGLSSPVSLTTRDDSSSAEIELDTDKCQMQLFLQAHTLLKKGRIYQEINGALKKSHVFRPNVHILPQTLELQDGDDRETVTSLHRDAAVSNIRFLNIFYGFSPKTFALAVNILDRIICKVKAHPKYLSCIATCCFYIAAQTQVQNVFIPKPAELVKLSQCGGTVSDLYRMEKVIIEKLQWQVDAVTPLTFLHMFYELFSSHKQLSNQSLLSALTAKLEVLMCQFEFAKYRAETLALSLLSCVLQDIGALHDVQHFANLVELQCYCQVSDAEFLQCRNLIVDYLHLYVSQPSKLPRLQLVWTVSRRTMNKMKPSTKVLLDLEPIWEDEDIEDDEDAGKFDSENSDSELERKNQLQRAIPHNLPPLVPKLRPQLQTEQRVMPTTGPPQDMQRPDPSFTMRHTENGKKAAAAAMVADSGGLDEEQHYGNDVVVSSTDNHDSDKNNNNVKKKKNFEGESDDDDDDDDDNESNM